MAEPGEGGEVEPASEALLLMAGGDGDGNAEELVEVLDLEPPGPGKGKKRDRLGRDPRNQGFDTRHETGIWAFPARNLGEEKLSRTSGKLKT